MSQMNKFFAWFEDHREIAYGLIRIYLGVALFVRGWLFMSDPSALTKLAGAHQVYWWYSYIVGAHLVGGFLLAIGYFTRLAALLQIPVLFGAVVLIHLEQGLMTVGQSLELATLILFLLVIYFFFGAGPLSVDSKKAQKQLQTV
jgi:uncharacterized membrane protein YphA (DoxX/SURF4 family)